MGADDTLLGLFGHFLAMSMLAVGGALAVTPGIHSYLVDERGWLTDAQFSAGVAIAQAAPGPNLLFVPVLGYAVAGLAGAFVSLAGMLIPSTALALAVSRWGGQRRETRFVRAFVAGLAPVTVGLLAASAILLAAPYRGSAAALALVVGAALLAWRTKASPVWLIAAGAAVGALGWV
jgi:chromate transporter